MTKCNIYNFKKYNKGFGKSYVKQDKQQLIISYNYSHRVIFTLIQWTVKMYLHVSALL